MLNTHHAALQVSNIILPHKFYATLVTKIWQKVLGTKHFFVQTKKDILLKILQVMGTLLTFLTQLKGTLFFFFFFF